MSIFWCSDCKLLCFIIVKKDKENRFIHSSKLIENEKEKNVDSCNSALDTDIGSSYFVQPILVWRRILLRLSLSWPSWTASTSTTTSSSPSSSRTSSLIINVCDVYILIDKVALEHHVQVPPVFLSWLKDYIKISFCSPMLFGIVWVAIAWLLSVLACRHFEQQQCHGSFREWPQ